MSQGEKNETGNTIAEGRIAPRREMVRLVWYKILEDGPEEEQGGTGAACEGISKMCDISASGMGLYVAEQLPIGRIIFTEVSTRSFTFSAVGRIVYSKAQEDGFFRIGINFLIVPPNDRWYLIRHFKDDGKA